MHSDGIKKIAYNFYIIFNIQNNTHIYMKKFTLALGLAALMPIVGNAQRYLGIATSNWSGTNALYLNPANLADNRHKFSIDLFSTSVSLDNNFAKAGFSDVTDLVKDSDKGLNGLFNFSGSQNGKYTLAGPNVEFRGPGFMASIGRKHSIAVTTRLRFMMQAHDINGSLFQSIVNDDFSNNQDLVNSGVIVKASSFNATANLWSEIGLSYGGVVFEADKHQVKVGGTIRLLRGAGYFSFVNKNLDLQYYAGTDSVQIRNTDLSYGSTLQEGTDDLYKHPTRSNGSGFGIDLGVVYEFRPNADRYRYDMNGKTGIVDPGKNPYLLRFSAAVTDLGSIKYKTNNQTASFQNNPTYNNGVGYIRGLELAGNLSSFTKLKNYMATRGFLVDTSESKETKVSLPTSLILGLDYHIWRGFYANLLYTHNMANREKFGTSYYSQFTFTPRFDIRALSIGLPITYNTLNKSKYLGVGVRFGGFFVGSDNLIGFGDNYGMNAYFGASIPINRKKPKDSDGDGVSNKYDKCKREKGEWAFKGCPNPDKDGDGVLDKDDKCPDIAGTSTASGCPDADADGIADADDACPEQAGLAGMNGCPDRDGDGVTDKDDACPDVAGLAGMKGCPDTDKDGIADNEDQCPQQPGSMANGGCPDTDGDGIADNVDKCPTTAGTAANNGCPEVSEATKKRLSIIGGAIQFDNGKATVKKVSFVQLDEVVKIMNANADYNMSIEGHTDNSGKPETNMALSQQRADAVKSYMVSKGIDAGRLTATGYGDTKPVADNKTPANKAKNRRVVMTLTLKD